MLTSAVHIRDDFYFHRYTSITNSECWRHFFFYSPPFISPHVSGRGGGALSPFPYSLALVYCPAPLPSSLHLVTPTGEAESQRTCLFINVADGSRQRRKERAVRREAESETRAGERKRAREKKEVSVKESNWSTSTLPVNWWTTRWSNAPGGRLVTSKESSILQPLPETEWKFHFLLIFTHSWLTHTQASLMLWCTRAKQSVKGCCCPAWTHRRIISVNDFAALQHIVQAVKWMVLFRKKLSKLAQKIFFFEKSFLFLFPFLPHRQI